METLTISKHEEISTSTFQLNPSLALTLLGRDVVRMSLRLCRMIQVRSNTIWLLLNRRVLPFGILSKISRWELIRRVPRLVLRHPILLLVIKLMPFRTAQENARVSADPEDELQNCCHGVKVYWPRIIIAIYQGIANVNDGRDSKHCEPGGGGGDDCHSRHLKMASQ